MPVKSNSGAAKECCGGKHCCCGGFAKKLIITLLGILLVYIIVLLGTVIRNNLAKYEYIGQADRAERTITVEGQGKVVAKPDIAVTTLGTTTEAKTVAEAQKKNTETMNALVAKLKESGVSGDDIQTSFYNIHPQYDYNDSDAGKIDGYEVLQEVRVKIRDLSKVSQVLALAGQVGANSVSGLEFTIDDDEVYKAEARQKAIEKVASKAKSLSEMLGVEIVDMAAYSEYEGDGKGYRMYDYAVGLGGADTAPAIESGSMEVVMNVVVTLGIK